MNLHSMNTKLTTRTGIAELLWLLVLLEPSPVKVHGFSTSLIPSKPFRPATTVFVTSSVHTTNCHPQHYYGIRRSRLLCMVHNNHHHHPILPNFENSSVGIQRDFRHRGAAYWTTDWTDGWNAQTLASILFLFFACLAPAIGFGAILERATCRQMGCLEMVTSTSLCGVLYAVFAPQPMQLIGPMGPNLAFTLSLVPLAQYWNVSFLPLYAWTGLWTAFYLGVAACTSASNLVQHLTKFTDEIFSVLISTIFLFGAVRDIQKPFGLLLQSTAATAATTSPPLVALMTLVCALTTFGSATLLKSLQTGRYFNRWIRTQLANFAPAIGVVLGTLVASKMKPFVTLPALSLPSALGTTSGRPWLVPLTALPVWARWASALPAVLAFCLLFLDQNITARLVNNPRNQMTKGNRSHVLDGVHGDMLVLSVLTGLTSLLGLPWMAGATTRSAAHVRSLLVWNETKIESIRENRLSGAVIHALIGACVLCPGPRHWLAQVPLPVLSGVFLYLGLTSLQGLELWDRIRGLFQDNEGSSKRRWSPVKRRITTLYTGVQLLCVGGLMKITDSSWGVLAPLLIAVLPLLRRGLVQTKVVPEADMQLLDG